MSQTCEGPDDQRILYLFFLEDLGFLFDRRKEGLCVERAPIGIGSAGASPLSSLEKGPAQNTLCKGARDLDKPGCPRGPIIIVFSIPLDNYTFGWSILGLFFFSSKTHAQAVSKACRSLILRYRQAGVNTYPQATPDLLPIQPQQSIQLVHSHL
jgi:hypothetical protein